MTELLGNRISKWNILWHNADIFLDTSWPGTECYRLTPTLFRCFAVQSRAEDNLIRNHQGVMERNNQVNAACVAIVRMCKCA